MALETRKILQEDGTELAVLEVEDGVLKRCIEKCKAEYSILDSDLQGITSIFREAFRYCTGLTKVITPDSVTSIGRGAFIGCTSLKESLLQSLLICLIERKFIL